MGPVSGGPCNILTFLAPLPEQFVGEGFLYSQAMECKEFAGDIPNVLDMLPDNWDRTIVAHHYPIEELVGDMMMSGVFGIAPDALAKYREEGISHIAVLEGPVVPEDTQPWRFDDLDVKGLSALVLWCEERKTYRFIHCAACSRAFVAWICHMQAEWKLADGETVQGVSHTRH